MRELATLFRKLNIEHHMRLPGLKYWAPKVRTASNCDLVTL